MAGADARGGGAGSGSGVDAGALAVRDAAGAVGRGRSFCGRGWGGRVAELKAAARGGARRCRAGGVARGRGVRGLGRGGGDRQGAGLPEFEHLIQPGEEAVQAGDY